MKQNLDGQCVLSLPVPSLKSKTSLDDIPVGKKQSIRYVHLI